MANSQNPYVVSSQMNPPEVHYELSGIIDAAILLAFQKELYRNAKPFIEGKQPFRVLGDMREFGVQTQDVAELMRKSQEDSVKLGMERMAILHKSTLVKLQFKRVSEMVDIEFFEDKSKALDWLRG